MVQPRWQRAKADLDVAQAFPIGQLSERYAQELVQARKALDLLITSVQRHQAAEFRQRE